MTQDYTRSVHVIIAEVELRAFLSSGWMPILGLTDLAVYGIGLICFSIMGVNLMYMDKFLQI